MSGSMPPGGATLPAETYLAIAAYLLQANGAAPGAQPLVATTAVAIGAVASGARQTAANATAPAAQGAAPAQGATAAPPPRPRAGGDPDEAGGGGAPRAPIPPPRGSPSPERFPTIVPVTDEMLRNPPPGDWLMARRNYQAWSYSPLSEITAATSRTCAWRGSWAMNEGAGQSDRCRSCTTASCISTNTMNTVQALDAADRRADLGEPGRPGPGRSASARCATARIYGDKVLLATTDARLVALDARTGKVVWDDRRSPIAAKGFSNTSGPIVVKGKVIQGLQGCDRYRAGSLLHQRLRRQRRQAALEVPHHRAHGRAGRRHVGQAARHDARRRRDVDRRQLRSRSRSHLLGHRAGQAVDAGQPRQHASTTRRSTPRPPSRCARTTARSRGTTSTCPASRSTSTRCSSACSSTSVRAEGALHDRQGRHSVEARSRAPGKYLGHKETVFQNVFDAHRSEDRRPDVPRRHHRAARSTSGCRRARAPRADTTGRR